MPFHEEPSPIEALALVCNECGLLIGMRYKRAPASC